MTIDEMIKILEAYKKGENIEYQFIGDKDDIWIPIRDSNFNFDDCVYRIKEKLELPFEVGDIIVDILKTSKVYEIIEINLDENTYRVKDISDEYTTSIYIGKCQNFINAFDDRVLWYWEVKEKNKNDIKNLSERLKYRELKELCKSFNIEYAKPLYALGYVLKDENDKPILSDFLEIKE